MKTEPALRGRGVRTQMPHHIYCLTNPSMWWFDDNGTYNREGRGVPHPLCKHGRTEHPRDRDNAYLNEAVATGMPTGYRCEFLMRVNDAVAAERKVGGILKQQGRHCPPDTVGLGKEWYYATPEYIRGIFDAVAAEFEGVYVDPPRARAARLSEQEILKLCAKYALTTSAQYTERAEELCLPPAPWKEGRPYPFLNPTVETMPIEAFVAELRRSLIRTVSEYDDWRPPSFPTRQAIEDGYFPQHSSLLEILAYYMPTRGRFTSTPLDLLK